MRRPSPCPTTGGCSWRIAMAVRRRTRLGIIGLGSVRGCFLVLGLWDDMIGLASDGARFVLNARASEPQHEPFPES